MDSQLDDIVKKLLSEKNRLVAENDRILDKITRVDKAITALSGEGTAPENEVNTPARPEEKPDGKTTAIIRRRTVGWSSEVDKVFLEYNNLKPSVVIAKLTENGVPGLDDIETKKSVYATLNRKVNEGGLYRNESGEYCKK